MAPCSCCSAGGRWRRVPKSREVVGGAHRFVGHAQKRHRRQIASHPRGGDRGLGALAGSITSSLGVIDPLAGNGADDGLLDPWRAASRGVAEGVRLHWHDPPANHIELFGTARRFEELSALLPLPVTILARRIRQEGDGNSKRGRREGPRSLYPRAKEGMRD